MEEDNRESQSLHSTIEFDPQALKLLGEWGVVVRGSQIINTRPYARFANLAPSGIDLMYSQNLKRARLFRISDNKVGLMLEFNDGTVRSLGYENTEQGVKEILE